MPQRSKRGKPKTSTHKRHAERRPSKLELDQYLLRIFSGLSQLLVSQGFGFGRLSKLMKFALIDTAKTLGSKGSTRSNIARVATLTGLTRVEVSRFIRSHQPFDLGFDQSNRATRVALGWMSDKSFVDARGKPRALNFSIDRGEFRALVKKYSGDIPARAMLSEMLRLGMVRYVSKGQITLLNAVPKITSTTASAIRAIAPWVNQIADASSNNNALSSRTQQLKIHFGSVPEVLAATRELDQRWASFIAGIRHLGTSKKLVDGLEITISTAIATSKPIRHKKKRR